MPTKSMPVTSAFPLFRGPLIEIAVPDRDKARQAGVRYRPRPSA
jgi:hypothetical protein